MSLIKEKINPEKLPQHVAIIMDGNGRWAKSRGEERTFGHKNAIDAVRNAINACNEVHIPYLTLYTFSSENWNRPEAEVNTLMSLLTETLLLESEEIFTKGLRMHVIGNIEKLSPLVKDQLMNVVELTKDNTKGNLILAISYGSQEEILNAVKK
ncbi:polyprenyl diphosphate synthase, partial [Anaerorhabdus sp.]